MLDNETKRRIDAARDILVGKLPDPKSQVEQITIALIYKFMDDMDAQSVEFGGEPSFFVGDYERFGWRKIFSPSIGGFEMLNLYGEAITSLNQNPHLPQLFRDVFKNAFLPYRDPETLKLFLKTINEFQYDHSERLGDAFEYLLSVLGSQGDAGQFRTPRHIIDFIVEVVQPKKNETVCDPACGTAGFLISAYKHILRANTRRTQGDLLTPDERRKLMTNFVGYDISPDMVRLSLVNMYLHGFPDPHIYEYDTLTSEERWNESFDVVMANPPFMSPKGGIKPHKRFSLQANRSEVLFVDYLAEHINPLSGRAGVIVPEGIIFQTANAYRDLRKMLVEKSFLYAVVSLPAGVFQPYSGVKTSILFFDKTLAAKSDRVLFVKINNDGFSLGAQRKELKTSDLPDALNVILDFQKAILHGDTSRFAETELPLQAFAVEKTRIAANGEYNLIAERYRKVTAHHSTKWSYFKISELFKEKSFRYRAYSGEVKPEIYSITMKNGLIKQDAKFKQRIASDNIAEYKLVEFSDLVVGFPIDEGVLACLAEDTVAAVSPAYQVWQPISDLFLPKFFNYLLRSDNALQTYSRLMRGTTSRRRVIEKNVFVDLAFPLPPLSVQKEIVERVEGYQRLIDGAKQVVKSFKPNIQLNPDWQIVELGEVVNIKTGKLNANAQERNGAYPFFTCSKEVSRINRYSFDCEALLLSGNNASGDFDVKHYKGKFDAYQRTYVITIKDHIQLLYPFVRTHLESKLKELKKKSTGGLTRYLTLPMLTSLQLPLPPLEEQQRIVAQIEREQSLVNANRELIEIYERKIKDEINQLWEPTADELTSHRDER